MTTSASRSRRARCSRGSGARGDLGPLSEIVKVGPLELSVATMQVRYPGCAIELTSYEFTIFRVLAQRAGRAQIMELAKGNSEDAFDRSIDVRISLFARSSANSPAALEHQDRARRRLRARLRGL